MARFELVWPPEYHDPYEVNSVETQPNYAAARPAFIDADSVRRDPQSYGTIDFLVGDEVVVTLFQNPLMIRKRTAATDQEA